MFDPWEKARAHALALLENEERRLLFRLSNADASANDVVARIEEMAAERALIERPMWMPKRKRKSPSLASIAAYWATRYVFEMSPERPHCFACLRLVPDVDMAEAVAKRWNGSTSYLEKAHLVDHTNGGLDGPQNVVPLCSPCHSKMPGFDIGEGASAIIWVRSGELIPPERAARLIPLLVALRRDGIFQPDSETRPVADPEPLPPRQLSLF